MSAPRVNQGLLVLNQKRNMSAIFGGSNMLLSQEGFDYSLPIKVGGRVATPSQQRNLRGRSVVMDGSVGMVGSNLWRRGLLFQRPRAAVGHDGGLERK